ncbi:MAG TPA: LssY C-terminal domain-containing protein [Candidatus Sulfotelmatobacter sp.]|nr:LssY C-terminal domain-containing protein [Candidatus Sulfotelmatobacter sp.]
MHRCLLLLVTLAAAIPLNAQSGSNSREVTFQISSSPAWTDTALNLEPGATVTIVVVPVTSTSSDSTAKRCDPAGLSNSSANTAGLPVPEAGPGALIAKLQADASPMLVGARREFHIDKPSHLFLGMNLSGTPACQGRYEVKVQTPSAASGAANPSSTQQATRGAQLKSQLATAAQVFMSGQFGVNNPTPNSENATSATGADASPAPVLHVSETPLDADLRKQLDGLPRRVNDQFSNLGDMVNFVIVGSQQDVQSALAAADWHVADTNNTTAVLSAVMQTYDSKDYLAMPMSTLFLFGRKQDFGYEMAEPIAMVASRHHFRIWKAPFTWNGQEVWCGAGTHDIGFAKDKRNNNVTHKIDPAVDGERDNIGVSLQKSNKAKTFSYYLPPNPVQDAKNATGDGYHSDGRMLVIVLH